jgi:hypothetical protein
VKATNSVELTVTDSNGLQSSSDATVNILSQSNSRLAAHFTFSVGGRTGTDGRTLSASTPPGGEVSIGLKSTSVAGASPIKTYVWALNGVPTACSGPTCVTTVPGSAATITLTVTDATGQRASASAVLRIVN